MTNQFFRCARLQPSNPTDSKSSLTGGKMTNNTTSLVEGSDKTGTLYLSDLDLPTQVTLSVILGMACPLGLFAELYLILKLLKKDGKRLWDHLTLVMEVLHWLFAHIAHFTIKFFHPQEIADLGLAFLIFLLGQFPCFLISSKFPVCNHLNHQV